MLLIVFESISRNKNVWFSIEIFLKVLINDQIYISNNNLIKKKKRVYKQTNGETLSNGIVYQSIDTWIMIFLNRSIICSESLFAIFSTSIISDQNSNDIFFPFYRLKFRLKTVHIGLDTNKLNIFLQETSN